MLFGSGRTPMSSTSTTRFSRPWQAGSKHENLFLGLEYNLRAQLWTQVLGILTCAAWTFSMAYLMFRLIKATIGLRVSEAEEIEGLDLGEHGSRAYPDFVQTPSSGGMGLTHS